MTLNTIFPVIYTIESIDLPSSGVDYEVGPTGLDYMTPYRITVDETLSYTLGIHSSDTSPGLVTDIITAPNPWQLCIIEQGDLYVCDVRYPQSFAKIDELYDGIVAIKPIVDQGIILFITHIGMRLTLLACAGKQSESLLTALLLRVSLMTGSTADLNRRWNTVRLMSIC